MNQILKLKRQKQRILHPDKGNFKISTVYWVPKSIDLKTK